MTSVIKTQKGKIYCSTLVINLSVSSNQKEKNKKKTLPGFEFRSWVTQPTVFLPQTYIVTGWRCVSLVARHEERQKKKFWKQNERLVLHKPINHISLVYTLYIYDKYTLHAE